MDWIHCNNCFSLPDCEKIFFLTSCGHIFCRDCEESCARGQCKLCGNQCTVITLSSTMKPDVQMYFTDPDDLLKKKIKEVHQVSEFQKNHRARLVSHQRKQLKKLQAMKEDFRKLIKNLKDLDGDRKKLLQENDVMKKFINMQRNTPNSNHGSAQRSEKSRKSQYEISPLSNLNTVLTKFADNRMENYKTPSGMPQRMCVISPPQNGKLGVIPSTPSPSSSMQKLSISSHPNELLKRCSTSEFATPNSTPGSICDKYRNFTTPQSSGPSTLDSYNSPTDYHLKNPQYKREVRKLVVHPYSPDDCSPLTK